METNVIAVNTLDDKEEVANQFKKYDFLAMPVVDKEFRLVGIVTVDDAIDVMEEEVTEDIEMMAGITPTDKPYLKTSVFEYKGIEKKVLDMIEEYGLKEKIIISSFNHYTVKRVKELCPDYKVYLRHHPYIPAWDINYYFI